MKAHRLWVYLITPLVLLSLALCTLLQQSGLNTNQVYTQESVPQDVESPLPALSFYGLIAEYAAGPAACQELQEMLADQYNIRLLQVDWGNLDTVVRTGISSGEPCDVYQYWPQNMRSLADSGMALDLTPYIEADPEFQKMVPETALRAGQFDGKYYSVPFVSNFSLIVANATLLDELSISLPDQWNWQEFLSVCRRIQRAGICPMAQNTDNQQSSWMFRNGMLSLAAEAGQLDELANGQIPMSDPMFTTVFTNIQELYESGYLYPGNKADAVTVTRDEMKAAFLTGKVAFIGDVAASAADTVAEAEAAGIEAVLLPWPSMGSVNAVLGGYDGLFIPINAPDPDASFQLIRTYLSEGPQKLYADSGMAIVNPNVEITNPIAQTLADLSESVYTFEFYTLNAKINEYFNNDLLVEVVLGDGVAAAQNALEQLRISAISR